MANRPDTDTQPPGASAPRLPQDAARWTISHTYRDGEFYGATIRFYDEAGNFLDEGTY